VAYHNLGVTLAETGRTKEAIQCYSMALGILPDFAPSRINLARALAATGQTNPAIAQCVKSSKAIRAMSSPSRTSPISSPRKERKQVRLTLNQLPTDKTQQARLSQSNPVTPLRQSCEGRQFLIWWLWSAARLRAALPGQWWAAARKSATRMWRTPKQCVQRHLCPSTVSDKAQSLWS
jgi:tetratricopeptide (TPR) repeat protein